MDKETMSRLEHLKTMPYDEYLKTDEWKETRKKCMQKANFKCELCLWENIPLHVHHKTYERLGEELPEDLIVLCETCHSLVHKKLDLNAESKLIAQMTNIIKAQDDGTYSVPVIIQVTRSIKVIGPYVDGIQKIELVKKHTNKEESCLTY